MKTASRPIYILWSVIRGIVLTSALGAPFLCAQGPAVDGPFRAHLVEGGPPLVKALSPARAGAEDWTEAIWFQTTSCSAHPVGLTENGDAAASSGRLSITDESITYRMGGAQPLLEHARLCNGAWHLVAISVSKGKTALYIDGALSATSSKAERLAGSITMAPLTEGGDEHRFSGEIGSLTLSSTATSKELQQAAFAAGLAPWVQPVETNAKSWPLQTHQQVGYTRPQSPETYPRSRSSVAVPAETKKNVKAQSSTLGQWKLISDLDLPQQDRNGQHLSQSDVAESKWITATVPGTVLTSLIDQGIYPDPYYGLNNLQIPESLSQHDWWYRCTFAAHRNGEQRKILHFAGINYEAAVWLNGAFVGKIRGAFRRADFDVTALLAKSGENVLAIKISPPPNAGIPQEQSLLGGPGENGGSMVLDGPTFVAAEGWDWIPAIRDRNIGLWQDVSLQDAGALTLGDPQVVSHLPLPRTDAADLTVRIPIHSEATQPSSATLDVAFEGVSFTVKRVVPPGDSEIFLSPADAPSLHVDHPRLWWPNGYGKPELYHLKIEATVSGSLSDKKISTFGIREVSYELSLFNGQGQVHRFEATPTETWLSGSNPVDVRHVTMKQTVSGWASSATPSALGSPALREIKNPDRLTDLVIRVNGVRIAARGGNWGMDDALKRVDRARLEPYFRLHRDANLNIIRNWVGQDSEETFFELADEYGLMVWNDFWASTQDYNAEPTDTALFLDNARDTVRHFRNHPSIILWCGRNEGVPPPALNQGLIDLLAREDGTRLYSPSSNRVNLRDSGPYSWQEPSLYFSKLNRGFSVELGISSFPTMESFQANVPVEDQWPISDTWAYHDWHQKGGGDTHRLMQELGIRLGDATSLSDFEKKIQIFNYTDHRAIFEGFYQHLWQPNSGRMLWMTQPAWPSTMWQIYSSDYDTQASYYAVKKANEPLHVQMDLSDWTIAAVNLTREDQRGLRVRATVYSAMHETLKTEDRKVDAMSNRTTTVTALDLAPLLASKKLVFVRLQLLSSEGAEVSNNFYWIAETPTELRRLNDLPKVSVRLHDMKSVRSGDRQIVTASLHNDGNAPAIETKLTLVDSGGKRVLPAYYDDNYISLLPDETRKISIDAPYVEQGLSLKVRGWNVDDASTPVQ